LLDPLRVVNGVWRFMRIGLKFELQGCAVGALAAHGSQADTGFAACGLRQEHAMDHALISPLRLAAIVYDDGIAVDAVMADFARDLQAAGTRVVGLVQVRPAPRSAPGATMSLRDVDTGDVMSICQDLGAGAMSCKLDADALADASVRLRHMADAPSDLLFISKFSKEEAAGRGFRTEFAHALENGRTVLTAVKRGLVADWVAFTGGNGALLECDPVTLRDWWRRVQARAA
jgi:molybdate transport system ATP-binding protein